MNEHLPECLRIVGTGSGPCICWLLRACEERVRANDSAATGTKVQDAP